MALLHGRAGQKQRALRQAAAGFVHGDGGHIGPRGHRGDGKSLPEIEMGSVRFVGQTEHPMLMRQTHNRAQIRTDAVISRVIDQHSLRVRIFPDRLLHRGNAHSQRDTETVIAFRVDIDRNRAAQHHRAHHAAVHVAGKDDLFSPLGDGKHHTLHRRGRSSHHEESVCRPKGLRGQLFRLPDHGNGVAEVVQRLHGVDVHGNALFPEKLRQLRVAASALVAGHIEGNDAHLAESFERLINRRALLIVKLQIVPLLSKCSGR